MHAETRLRPLALAIMLATSGQLVAAEQPTTIIDELVVVGKSLSYANNTNSEAMARQQTAMTSPLAVIDNLPGVLINEGDTFGSDDWSTTVSIRGFQLSQDAQQLGMTIDGIANGNSNYGGGAKANRYIDTENLKAVAVSQGTGDIASRSHEALGGTLNFTTLEPGEAMNTKFSVSVGDHGAQKLFARFETGELLPETYAWVSASSAETSDWIHGSAANTRDHLAAKVVSTLGAVDLTGYLSYDDTHEDNYQRVSLQQFNENPEWDRLNKQWSGDPQIDQNYRRGWSTLRENLFGYLQFDFTLGAVDLSTNIYYHDNEGRGDWLPPYIANITDDGNAPHSELMSGVTAYGGSNQGTITSMVNAAGEVIPVSSYRHSHYTKERTGFNADVVWEATLGGYDNSLRGGIWVEDYQRSEGRDWHKIVDSRIGMAFDSNPYWVSYQRDYQVDTTMVYIEDSVTMGAVTTRLGLKKFFVDLERSNLFEGSSASVNSDSDVLLSAGAVAQLPVDGLEAFVGYAENFAAIKDEVLEQGQADFSIVQPETAENIDVGLRYVSPAFNASLTAYQIDFGNRLAFVSQSTLGDIDYTATSNGEYFNTGGIESKGLEAAMTVFPSEQLSLYASVTLNDSVFVGDSADYPAGNTVAGAVETMAVLSADWQAEHYMAGLSFKWVGERQLDDANTNRLAAYTVADLYAGVNLGAFGESLQGVDLKLTLNNLLDERYIGGVSGGAGWIAAPRTAALNLSAAF